MTLREMEAADIPAVQRFLQAHEPRAMFPLVNLRDHGLWRDHPTPPQRAVAAVIAEEGGVVTGFLGLTYEGMIMPVMPDLDLDLIALGQSIWSGRTLFGAVGAAAPVRAVLRHWGLHTAPTRTNDDEPHFTLALTDLQPTTPALGRLTPLSEPPRDLMVIWRMDYGTEVLGLADPASAAQDIDGYIARDSHRVLWVGGHPVAMTGFNARTDQCVQVGGVFTPPEWRGRGFASQALSQHLQEARDGGAERATLFAASAEAARLYERLGFQRIGDYALVLFETPQGLTP